MKNSNNILTLLKINIKALGFNGNTMLSMVVLALLLTLVACKKNKSCIYENACGVEALRDSVPVTYKMYDFLSGTYVDTTIQSQIYIPNIFIPDSSDNWSTDFKVFSGRGMEKILTTVISDENGIIMYSKENISPGNYEEVWNGKGLNGELFYGVFNYKTNVEFLDGQRKTYIGQACSYKCSDSDFPLENLPKCFFPYQHDGNGGFDPNRTYPKECFE
jgi:hypothetical protein